MFDYLLNNPLLFTAIMLVVVLVGVGLVLYFLVYKNRINEYFAKKKLEKQNQELQKEKNKALASNVFAKKEELSKEDKELSKKDHEAINRIISSASNDGSKMVTKVKKSEDDKPKKELTNEEQKEIDETILQAMGGAAKPKQGTAKPKTAKSKNDGDDDDDNIPHVGGLDYMNQFNNTNKD